MGCFIVHVGTHIAEKDNTSAAFGKQRRLVNTVNVARIGLRVLLGMLSILEDRCNDYKNFRRMASNSLVEHVYIEERVGFVLMEVRRKASS